MSAQEIISAIGLVGLGSVLTTIVNSFLRNREKKHDTNHQFKEVRYKAVVLLMYCYIEWENESKHIIQRPDIKSKNDLYNELKAEWINMSLYASDKVINRMKDFISIPNYETLSQSALAMRKDLYGLNSALKASHFKDFAQ